ncbi:uncharacterized protein LOC113507288 [Trichoplusia ni]|nr:uncharacterized protein LOC113507288 [Trichoplusia ni]
MPIIVVTGRTNYIISSYMTPPGDAHAIKKRETKTKENETEYDYDSLLDEYYEQEKNESRSKDTYQIKKTVLSDYGAINMVKTILLLRTETENCTQNVKGIGFHAIKCLIHDYNNERQLTKDISARMWKIIQIWFLVYLAIAVPVWCTRGWCCCCLRCKFFKPQQTIEEAKKYVVMYPPGVFKKKNGELIMYDPSPREKECYEEFKHFIKTL